MNTLSQRIPPLPTHSPSAVPRPTRPKPRMTPARASVYARYVLALLGFAGLATALTYRAGAGVNVPLVCGGLVALGLFRAADRRGLRAAVASRATRVQLVAWLAIAAATVIHFDDWTTVSLLLVTVTLSASLLTGATDPFRGLLRGLAQLVVVPWGYVRAWRTTWRWGGYRVGRGEVDVRKAAVPVAVAVAFGGLYVASNAALSDSWTRLVAWLSEGPFWADVFGVLTVATLWSVVGAGFLWLPARVRGAFGRSFGESPTGVADAAAGAWSSAALTLALVNALALVLNVTDVFTTWLAEPSASGAALTRGVHEGTWTLATAIVAAAAVMGYAFRQNPPDVRRARRLAIVWLVQNGVMALTVALRNGHYTDAYGLTYKRIGVYLFLLCAVAGLYFLGRKVWEGTGFEALVRRQAWAVYGVLALAALPSWPGLITRYNYRPGRQELDVRYLWRLAPYNLHVWAACTEDAAGAVDGEHVRAMSGRGWLRGPVGWRDWDYAEWRRGQLAGARKASTR